MNVINRLYFLFLISYLFFFNVQGSKADCLNISVQALKYTKSFCISQENASDELQKIINLLHENGGGIIYFSPGKYELKKTLYLKSNVSLYGYQGLTKLVLYSKEGFIVKNDEIVSFIHIKDLVFENMNSDYSYVFLIKGGLQNSIFENLRFYGSENQTLFFLCPDSKLKPPRNVIFNEFKNIYADKCAKCIIYEGKPTSVISENVWINIRLMNVYKKGVEAINWVDTEKWYNLYAMAINSDVILIDINAFNLEHAHGFHFYSPTLVYSWSLLRNEKKPVGIRLGKNTIRNIFIGVATDKKWNNFLIDDGAFSYYIVMDTVEDRSKLKPPQKSFVKVISKGLMKVEMDELK